MIFKISITISNTGPIITPWQIKFPNELDPKMDLWVDQITLSENIKIRKVRFFINFFANLCLLTCLLRFFTLFVYLFVNLFLNILLDYSR